MRGPNKHYDCTSGPNGTPCRYCTLKRYRARNEYRESKGLPRLTVPELPPAKRGHAGQLEPCPCKPCENNRWRVFDQRAGITASKTAQREYTDLDRRALENWPEEWGKRA